MDTALGSVLCTMAKKTAKKTAAAPAGENPRRPCPCGSGKRWKACHGAGDDVIVTRPFVGLAAECDLVALRELLPSATAPLPLATPLDVPVTVASVLPGACAALVRPDGEIWLGMQVQTRSGDLSVDLARALAWARTAAPGSSLPVVGPGTGEFARLQDVLDPEARARHHRAPRLRLVARVRRRRAEPRGRRHPRAGQQGRDAHRAGRGAGGLLGRHRHQGASALGSARAGGRAGRGARPAAGPRRAHAGLGRQPDSRYAGSFRAHGLLVPVWDLDRELHPKEWAAPVTEFAARLERALADAAPLTDAEHRARDALAGKQVTLR